MRKQERFEGIIGYFRDNVPIAQSELNFSNPFELLVAVMLSAQCTDRRVNMTTPGLFLKYPDAAHLAATAEDDVFEIIKSISYPRAKAGHLVAAARMVMERFNGEIPDDVDSLMEIPGVGRKTANVVASVIYDKPVIAVDTHVFRVAHRLGLSNGKTPYEVELDLEKGIPEELRPIAHHWLILHGRYVCVARKPKCASCPLTHWCKDFQKRETI